MSEQLRDVTSGIYAFDAVAQRVPADRLAAPTPCRDRVLQAPDTRDVLAREWFEAATIDNEASSLQRSLAAVGRTA